MTMWEENLQSAGGKWETMNFIGVAYSKNYPSYYYLQVQQGLGKISDFDSHDKAHYYKIMWALFYP